MAVYVDANVQGASALITTDIKNLSDFDGPCESSSREVFFGGSAIEFDWNDCIASVRDVVHEGILVEPVWACGGSSH